MTVDTLSNIVEPSLNSFNLEKLETTKADTVYHWGQAPVIEL